MSDAILGTGILLKAGGGQTPTETFTAVAEIVAVKPPGLSRNEIDVSNHNEGVEAKILGMLRASQLTCTVNWLPTDATHSNTSGGLMHDIFNNVKRNWQIQFPAGVEAGDTWTFAGRVQMFDPQEVTVDSPLQLAVAITVDGAITVDETEET